MLPTHKLMQLMNENKKTPFVISMTSTICESGITIKSIRKSRRLGKRPENNTNIPLLVTLDSEFTKRKIVSRLSKLRDDNTYSNIYM